MGGFHGRPRLPLSSLWLPVTASGCPWRLQPACQPQVVTSICGRRIANLPGHRRGVCADNLGAPSRTAIARSPRPAVIAAPTETCPTPISTSHSRRPSSSPGSVPSLSLEKRIPSLLCSPAPPHHVCCLCPRCRSCDGRQQPRRRCLRHPPVLAGGTPADDGPEECPCLPGCHRCCGTDEEHVGGWPRRQDRQRCHDGRPSAAERGSAAD